MGQNIVIVGAGVAGINAATKLVDNNFKGKITIIDMGKDPYNRLPEEVMTGMLGAGGWSDGKLTYHTSIGGHLSKYCGEEKAMELMDQVINNFKRFHPKPEEVQCSNPIEEPDFIPEELESTQREEIEFVLEKPTIPGKVNQVTRTQEVLEIVKEPLTISEVAEITGKPEPSVRRDLAKGVKLGLWKRIGKKGSKGVRYEEL